MGTAPIQIKGDRHRMTDDERRAHSQQANYARAARLILAALGLEPGQLMTFPARDGRSVVPLCGCGWSRWPPNGGDLMDADSALDTSAGPNRCWPWLGSATAWVWFDGRQRRVHRVVYQLGTGEQLGALVVTAECGNPKCVNPRHLTAATKKQIQSRRDRANRNNRNSGVRNVYRDNKRWRAQITERGIAMHIGTFDSVAEADAAARKVRARISA